MGAGSLHLEKLWKSQPKLRGQVDFQRPPVTDRWTDKCKISIYNDSKFTSDMQDMMWGKPDLAA